MFRVERELRVMCTAAVALLGSSACRESVPDLVEVEQSYRGCVIAEDFAPPEKK